MSNSFDIKWYELQVETYGSHGKYGRNLGERSELTFHQVKQYAEKLLKF
jgi:hypothetical protein